MATYTSKQANKPANSVGWSGQKITAVGTFVLADTRNTAPVTTGPLSGDVYRFVRLPQGAVIVGGRLFASRFGSGTSAASVTAQLNIGLSGAFKDLIDGTSYGATTASQALGALVPIDFAEASVGSIKSESGLNQALGGLLYTLGPLRLTEECFAQITFSGSVTSFISGAAISLEVEYYMGTHA
jgi:hypothetical protein